MARDGGKRRLAVALLREHRVPQGGEHVPDAAGDDEVILDDDDVERLLDRRVGCGVVSGHGRMGKCRSYLITLHHPFQLKK